MTLLVINGKEVEAKITFASERFADKKYGDKDENGRDVAGLTNIYMNLLDYSNKHLVAFWDCALVHLGKTKPSIEEIESALEAKFEEDGDTLDAFKDAFNAMDESSFFKKAASKFWKNFEMMKDAGKTEEEKESNKKMYQLMQETRTELTN